MQQGLCNGTVSVRLTVCLFQLSTAAAARGGFAAVGPAGRKYRSIAAQPAPSSNGAQQHGALQHGGLQQRRAVSRLQPPQKSERRLVNS